MHPCILFYNNVVFRIKRVNSNYIFRLETWSTVTENHEMQTIPLCRYKFKNKGKSYQKIDSPIFSRIAEYSLERSMPRQSWLWISRIVLNFPTSMRVESDPTGLITKSFFISLYFIVKYQRPPHRRGNYIFRSYQQLLRLSLEEHFELTRRPSRALLRLTSCIASGTSEIQGHSRVWHNRCEGPGTPYWRKPWFCVCNEHSVAPINDCEKPTEWNGVSDQTWTLQQRRRSPGGGKNQPSAQRRRKSWPSSQVPKEVSAHLGGNRVGQVDQIVQRVLGAPHRKNT